MVISIAIYTWNNTDRYLNGFLHSRYQSVGNYFLLVIFPWLSCFVGIHYMPVQCPFRGGLDNTTTSRTLQCTIKPFMRKIMLQLFGLVYVSINKDKMRKAETHMKFCHVLCEVLQAVELPRTLVGACQGWWGCNWLSCLSFVDNWYMLFQCRLRGDLATTNFTLHRIIKPFMRPIMLQHFGLIYQGLNKDKMKRSRNSHAFLSRALWGFASVWKASKHSKDIAGMKKKSMHFAMDCARARMHEMKKSMHFAMDCARARMHEMRRLKPVGARMNEMECVKLVHPTEILQIVVIPLIPQDSEYDPTEKMKKVFEKNRRKLDVGVNLTRNVVLGLQKICLLSAINSRWFPSRWMGAARIPLNRIGMKTNMNIFMGCVEDQLEFFTRTWKPFKVRDVWKARLDCSLFLDPIMPCKARLDRSSFSILPVHRQ